MQQSHIHNPPKPIDRPLCSKCGEGMWLARIEPADKPDGPDVCFGSLAEILRCGSDVRFNGASYFSTMQIVANS